MSKISSLIRKSITLHVTLLYPQKKMLRNQQHTYIIWKTFCQTRPQILCLTHCTAFIMLYNNQCQQSNIWLQNIKLSLKFSLLAFYRCRINIYYEHLLQSDNKQKCLKCFEMRRLFLTRAYTLTHTHTIQNMRHCFGLIINNLSLKWIFCLELSKYNQ